MNAFKTNRSLAILTGAVLLTPALFSASAHSAHAADKSETFKTGAVVLGAAAAYLALQSKTLPAAVAAAGGYYAYKKGQDSANDDRYDNGNFNRNDNNRRDNRESRRERRQERRTERRSDNSYSRNGNSDNGYNGGYYDNSGYDNSYNNGYDRGYDNSYDRDDDNGDRGYKNYGQWKKAQRTIR